MNCGRFSLAVRCAKIGFVKIVLNGETRELASGLSLRDLLVLFGLPTDRVAVELNKEVIRKADWEKIAVSESDRIEVVHFVGGG